MTIHTIKLKIFIGKLFLQVSIIIDKKFIKRQNFLYVSVIFISIELSNYHFTNMFFLTDNSTSSEKLVSCALKRLGTYSL